MKTPCFQVSYTAQLELEPYSSPNTFQAKLLSCFCSFSTWPGEKTAYAGSHEMLGDRQSLRIPSTTGSPASNSFAMNMLSFRVFNQRCPKLCLHLFLSAESHVHRNTTVIEIPHLPAATYTRVPRSEHQTYLMGNQCLKQRSPKPTTTSKLSFMRPPNQMNKDLTVNLI